MKKVVAAVLMSAAVAAPAFAADAPAPAPAPAPAASDSGYYMGVGAGVTRVSNVFGQKPSKAGGGLFSLMGGYQFNKSFATEIQYAYLGKGEFNTIANGADAKTQALSLSGVGTLPVTDSFGFYGKFGVAYGFTSTSGMPAAYGGKTRFGTTVGLGVQYNIVPSVGLRFGWDRFEAAAKNVNARDDYFKTAWSLGALYRF